MLLPGVRGDHDERGSLPSAGELPGYIETRLLAQADIDQQDVRLQFGGALDGLGSTVSDAGHGNPVPFQHCPSRVEVRRVVIH